MKNHHSLLLLLLVIAGCSSNSGLTSSFSNRKYTRGYFFDNRGVKPEVQIKAEVQPERQMKPIAEKDTKLANIIMLTKTNELTNKNKSIVKQVVKEYKNQVLAITKQPITTNHLTQTIEQINAPADQAPAVNKQQLTSGKVLITIGLALIALTIVAVAFATIEAFPVWITLLIALSLLIIGMEFYIDALKESNPGSVTPERGLSNENQMPDGASKGKATNYGGTSLGLAIIGFLLGLFLGFALGLAAVLGATAISAAIVMGVPAVLLIIALILGIMGRNSPTEKHPGSALAGIIISAIMLALIGTAIFAILSL